MRRRHPGTKNAPARGRGEGAPSADRRTSSGARGGRDRKRPAGGSPANTAPTGRDGNRRPPGRGPRPAVPTPDTERATLADVRPGRWLFTTREGAERDLLEELSLWKRDNVARVLGPALVLSERAPSREGRLDSTFGRQCFQVSVVARGSDSELADQLAEAFSPELTGARGWVLQAWTPDTERGNRDAPRAHSLEGRLAERLSERAAGATRFAAKDLGPDAVPFFQVCLLGEGVAAGGVISSNRALSLAPGGRLRAHVAGDKPSRAARKLAEAFLWLGLAPEPGDQCVDLGAAPGGWTYLLSERRAKVIAVDPGKLRPDLLARKGVRYVGMSAFEFEPEEPVDWLLCDMAWRPTEVAKMLARWARNRDTTMLVANFKLPMKRKAETVQEIRKILEEGGYRSVRTRQLYHDRDEITLTARVG
ncbi:MAG TPA: SAM-dependent methyltransferase [Polyangiaceae bacterium]|nr:SAM-dependent methyltransferase [Polyangiaceae bacterium]